MICVPASRVLDVLRDAVAAGVRTAVIVSSGFGELGAEGARAQHDIAALARAHDVRVVGPNCLGLLCNHPDIRLNATFHDAVPPTGGLAVASQSGGVGIVLMDLARELELGVHTFVSLGNKADVSSNDLLAAWYDDPEVTAAALYLESFGNAAKFARFARRFAERKPLLAVVGGRSAGGSRAGASHTAAAATSGRRSRRLVRPGRRDRLPRRRGPRPHRQAARRAAAARPVDGSRSSPTPAASACWRPTPPPRRAWTSPEFSPDLQGRLAALVHGTSGTTNPVDAGAGVSPAQLAELLDTVLESREVDAVLVVPVATGVTDGSATMSELTRVRSGHPDLPVVAVPAGWSAGSTFGRMRTRSRRTGPQPPRCGLWVARCGYAEWRAVQRSEPARTEPELAVQLRGPSPRAAGRRPGAVVDAGTGGRAAAAYGIDVLGSVADSAAGRGVAPRGGAASRWRSRSPTRTSCTRPSRAWSAPGSGPRSEVREPIGDFRDVLGHAPEVLVQPMVSGTEVARRAGARPVAGPAGHGGGRRRRHRRVGRPCLPACRRSRPPTPRGPLSSLRIWPLLDGFRGRAAGRPSPGWRSSSWPSAGSRSTCPSWPSSTSTR